uniref:TAZ-type domain-containing protein n=1 Tax=Rhabditophanes sp. KR3021 TaxID=114890 RepID=A0AC35TMT0_9BILA
MPASLKTLKLHMIMLLHATKCTDSNSDAECSLSGCREMKDMIMHVSECHLKKKCKNKLCLNTKRLMNHWSKCKKTKCDICKNSAQPASINVHYREYFTSIPIPAYLFHPWHYSCSFECRKAIIIRILRSMCSLQIAAKYPNDSYLQLTKYVRKMEHAAFQTSTSKGSYFNTIGERIFEIQTKLEQLKKTIT